MRTKLHLSIYALTALLALGALAPQPVEAANPKAKKKIEEMKAKRNDGKHPRHAGLYHRWSLSAGLGYSWSNMDVDAAPHWMLEAQKRVSTYGVVAFGVNHGSHDLNTARGDADVLDFNVSYVRYVHEDTLNRQPNFYYGAGLNWLLTDVDRLGDSSNLGLHIRAGVEFKAGIFTELRYVWGPTVSKFNNARTGHLSVFGGYKWGL